MAVAAPKAADPVDPPVSRGSEQIMPHRRSEIAHCDVGIMERIDDETILLIEVAE